MNRLLQQRCHLHSSREAVARCPECERFYCRECITEHEGRVICTHCLGLLTQPKRPPKRRPGIWLGLGAVCGFAILWLLFLCLAFLLIQIPEKYHENTYGAVDKLFETWEGTP